MNYRVMVPGACGELVQGIIDEQNILVTCPIDIFSTAKLSSNSHFKILPRKANLARKLTLEYLKEKSFAKIDLESEIKIGKGMSSSSADIAAICQLTALSVNRQLTPCEIGKIASKIEPTDGTFCSGIVVYDYLNGEIVESLGNPPAISILAFDTGGKVDTISFNRRRNLKKLYLQNEAKTRQALCLIREGIISKNVQKIGQGAVISAFAHQNIMEKPLDDIVIISEKYKASGINVAHSGTIIGVLFDGNLDKEEIEICKKHIETDCSYLKFIGEHKMIAGGIYVEKLK